MRFYMTPGSCSTGIHILLEEQERVFEAYVLNLPAGDGRKPAYLALNPKGTVPTLVLDDGTVLTEFAAMAWWLAHSQHKRPLLPEAPQDMARALDIVSDVVGNIHGQGFTRIFTTDRYCLRDEDRDAVREQGRQLVLQGFARLATALERTDGPWCFDRFGAADAAVFYVEFWADRIGLPLPAACRRHFDAMCERPAVRRVLAEEGYRIRASA
ncbi:MAG: glutathione S-transferase N-terminal domain-containing protein [Rhodocyclaceae bacterium]|nr:glutathione S-transferase N-terminal domain-containing protein [Rhodocyclaceae bacterium]